MSSACIRLSIRATPHRFLCVEEFGKDAQLLRSWLQHVAVFSSYFYLLLGQRVPQDWAAQSLFFLLCLLTTRTSWMVNSVADLQFMNRCVLQVSALLEELGMVVTPDKSAIIVGWRGHAARQWIHTHLRRVQDREVLDLGLHGKPLLIPKVTQMTYLGVIMSYGPGEKQTRSPRLEVAALTRQQLQKKPSLV